MPTFPRTRYRAIGQPTKIVAIHVGTQPLALRSSAPTSTLAPASSSTSWWSTLSSGEKIGLGVAGGVAVLALGVALSRRRRRR